MDLHEKRSFKDRFLGGLPTIWLVLVISLVVWGSLEVVGVGKS